jgi:hypothetical protein
MIPKRNFVFGEKIPVFVYSDNSQCYKPLKPVKVKLKLSVYLEGKGYQGQKGLFMVKRKIAQTIGSGCPAN